ncbi:PREDICTED: uncharacterized protein LOC108359929 [Rhagoletis zephyria]|uniref:uncharacterized protein LOC108359929 n=1 Tax=Rhagoletis zephyria TaxID=28612 RepID=UPI000811774B|nr:PREDICTED: uncharacterized protein LOC108359929 [Rhagoletis zephyria]
MALRKLPSPPSSFFPHLQTFMQVNPNSVRLSLQLQPASFLLDALWKPALISQMKRFFLQMSGDPGNACIWDLNIQILQLVGQHKIWNYIDFSYLHSLFPSNFLLLTFFLFPAGKPCPEKTRPHKTRCESYYKCFALPSNRHVWIPEKCESGLIYEHNLGLCVLPDDEWECTLGVGMQGGKVEADKSNKAVAELGQTQIRTQTTQATRTNKVKDADLYIVNNKHDNDNENYDDAAPKQKNKLKENDMEMIVDSSVGSDAEVEREDSQFEASGDDVGELVEMDGFLQAENREGEDEHEEQLNVVVDNEIRPESVTKKSKIDPKLTAHLQRLSQLIDGLKNQYQQGDEQPTDLRPDQLNAFLAHFNIQNKFSLIKPTYEMNSKETTETTTTTEPPESTAAAYVKYQTPSLNKTRLQEHLDGTLKPETKVVLTNTLPKNYGTTGYSNSQIVVNRPEGSVLFTLPHYGNEQTSEYGHNTPKISEDTLKTVLELSKQMIATQNIPKIVPNTGYYAQPLIQPLFLPASAFQAQAQANPFAAYFNSVNNNRPQQGYDSNDGKTGTFTGNYNNQAEQAQLLRPAGAYNKPANTIIHNNVIPIHLTSTNSGEKEIVDSYGQSLGLYPPINTATDGDNGYDQHFHSHTFGDNKFFASLTTARPQISTTPAPTGYAAQFAAQYPTAMDATTTRPNAFQPTSPTLNEYFSPNPHLNENNVNKLFQSTDRYPTVQYDDLPRPMSIGRPQLFTPQMDGHKVKLRPNGHTMDSMEMEGDDYGENQARPLQQLFTYNYDNDKPDMGNQYQQATFAGSSSGGNKHTYIPRPSATRPSYTNAANKLKPYNTHPASSYADGTQLVNIGGNFVSFDVFQNTVLPLLGQTQSLNDLNNVEVITCATGVRQPNTTDCTRYYVCSKKDGKVLSYSCPPYTAFNAQTRICDAHTYAVCTPDAIISRYTVSENKRLQMEAIKAMQDVKRRQEQAMKAQNIANLLQKYGGQTQAAVANEDDSSEKDMLSAYVQQAAAMNVYSTTPRPTAAAATVKKRKYYCKEGDKIADQTSIYSYFVCYKNAQGMMKGHKMTCTKGLIFCAKSAMCTLASKCA